jgi:hypothetical protein
MKVIHNTTYFSPYQPIGAPKHTPSRKYTNQSTAKRSHRTETSIARNACPPACSRTCSAAASNAHCRFSANHPLLMPGRHNRPSRSIDARAEPLKSSNRMSKASAGTKQRAWTVRSGAERERSERHVMK